jgi:hypothetical protein
MRALFQLLENPLTLTALQIPHVVVSRDLFLSLAAHHLALGGGRGDRLYPGARRINPDGCAFAACAQAHRQNQQPL